MYFMYKSNHIVLGRLHRRATPPPLNSDVLEGLRRDLANNCLFHIHNLMCSYTNVINVWMLLYEVRHCMSVYILRHVLPSINYWSYLTHWSITHARTYWLVDNPYSSNKHHLNTPPTWLEHMISTTDCQKQIAVKSGETLLGYNTSSQSHTFHIPTFIYVTGNKRKLHNRNTEFRN